MCIVCFWGEYLLLISAFYLFQYANRELKKKRSWNVKTGCGWKERRLRRGRKDLSVRPQQGGGKFRGWSREAYSQLELIAEQHYGAHLRGCLPLFLLPFVVVAWWVQLPQVSISAEHLNCLSELSTRWRQSHVRECLVHAQHVQLHHGSLPGNTMPLAILNSGDLASLSSKGRLVSELSTQVRIRALGKIIATCGVKVSMPRTVRGRVTCTLAVLAPFSVGWWFNAGISILIPLFYALVVVLLVHL